MSDEAVQDSLFDAGASAPVVEDSATQARPDYISEQHWDPEANEVRVEALAKSFHDTKSALDKRFVEAEVPASPHEYVQFTEEGNMVVSDDLTSLPPIPRDDPLLNKVLDAAHEAQLPADKLGPIVNAFFEAQNELYESYVFDEVQVLSEVHENKGKAQAMVDAGNTYLHGLPLDDGMKEAAADLMANANGVKLLNALVSKATGSQAIPTTPAPARGDDRNAMMARWNELRSSDITVGSSEWTEFEGLGNRLFPGKNVN